MCDGKLHKRLARNLAFSIPSSKESGWKRDCRGQLFIKEHCKQGPCIIVHHWMANGHGDQGVQASCEVDGVRAFT
jgi:hypothetical protein